MSAGSSSRVWDAVRRFSTLVILCTIAGAAVAGFLSYRQSSSYSADAFYLVPPGGGVTGQTGDVTPFDAERFARTYAVVIATDERLLDSLSSRVGRSRDSLEDRIRAVALPNSSAVRVTYVGATRDEVANFFDNLTALVQQAGVSPNLQPDTLRLLQEPTDYARTGGGTWVAPVAGGIAGLLLALAAATLLTRALPRVRTAEDARAAGGPSVVEADLTDDDSVAALAVRAVGRAKTATKSVAVVALDADGREQAAAVADRLADATQALVASGSLPVSAGTVGWTHGSLGDGRGERAAQDATRTVLLVPTGTAMSDLGMRVAALTDLGVADQIVAVVPRRTLRGAGQARHRDPATGPDAVSTLRRDTSAS